MYAVLLRAKGIDVTCSDIHDAWSAWIAERNRDHTSLVVYEHLSPEVQREDLIFAVAVRRAAEEVPDSVGSQMTVTEVLFPSGPPTRDTEEIKQVIDLYKIMVGSSEALVNRRQGVNTFFLTMNGALLTASGIIAQNAGRDRLSGVGLAVLATAGAILCGAWRSLINSFGQLNRGKFQVINTIERHLKAAIYSAEWEALGRGTDPKVYRSFTSREIWVPNSLLCLHLFTIIAAILFALGVFTLGAATGQRPNGTPAATPVIQRQARQPQSNGARPSENLKPTPSRSLPNGRAVLPNPGPPADR
ncbi:MAG: hypothetical protein ACJ76Y_30675 [Thermoanaerobaculia bacterium]